LEAHDALALTESFGLARAREQAAELRDLGWGGAITYSRKVFVPLTQLWVATFVTIAPSPRRRAGSHKLLSAMRRLRSDPWRAEGGLQGSALHVGDKPERRYKRARGRWTAWDMRRLSPISNASRTSLEGNGLLPHLNPGLLERETSRAAHGGALHGLMLESAAPRLGQRGGLHFGSPDKVPAGVSQPCVLRAACKCP